MNKQEYKFLEWGYKTAIILSIIGLIASSSYLFFFLYKSNTDSIKLETMVGFSAERRMVLLSTAIFVAMSFGFLGFALFLIQAKGEIEGSLDYKNVKVNIARMSPGVFVILCATIIIIFSVTFRVEYKQSFNGNGPSTTSGTQQIDTSKGIIPDEFPEPEFNFKKDTIKKDSVNIKK